MIRQVIRQVGAPCFGATCCAYSGDVELLVELLPSVGLLAIFAIVIRAIVHADRRERAAAAKYDAEAESRRATSDLATSQEDDGENDSPSAR